MKSLVFLACFCGSLKAQSVFVSPIADFRSRTIILSFLPDIRLPLKVSECWISKKGSILYKFAIDLELKPQMTIKSFEKKLDFPKGLNEPYDLSSTEVQCRPGIYKISTWRLEGVNE